jgi:hypothetical protein
MLLAAGVLGTAIIVVPIVNGGDDDDAKPQPVTQVSGGGGGAQQPTTAGKDPTVRPGPTQRPTPVDDLRGDPDNVILTITANGMPARISAQATNPSVEVRQRQKASCVPDDQFPGPCVTYYVAKRGTEMKITAGDSRAGYWPVLQGVHGGGCELPESSQDVSCTINLQSDVEVTATYYGSDTPNGTYVFPVCPAKRSSPQPSWASRC